MWVLGLALGVLRRAPSQAAPARPVAACTVGGKPVPCPTVADRPVALARAAAAGAAPAAPAEDLPADLVLAMEYDYTLQYISVDPALGSPRSPNDPMANRCLSSEGLQDEVGGIGLGFSGCSHYPQLDDRGQPQDGERKPNETILFNFFPDGRLRNKATGLCVRRVACGAIQTMIYDLGPCEEESASTFLVWESTFGRADSTSLLGPPLRATATACGSCGPFLMKQLCGTQATAISCGTHFIEPGWTKDRNMLRPKYEKVNEFTLSFAPSPRSLCGTMVQETPRASPLEPDSGAPPWYYFHRYKDGELRKMGNVPPPNTQQIAGPE